MLNYNSLDLIKVSIPSIYKQTFNDFELIIVDNGSTDNSLDYLRNNLPQIRIFKSPKNSFSIGNNIGIKNAKGKYILILNNDIELDKNCLMELYKNFQNSNQKTGMWATKILNFYNRNIIDSVGLIVYPDGMSRGQGRLEEDQGQFDSINEVCFPSGCAGLYKKEMLDEIGFFDEDFEFYVEDSDLGFRARLAGWNCIFVPKAIVYHMYSATAGEYSRQKAFLVERNRLWLTIKNFPLPLLIVTPYFTIKRYLFQIYSVIAKRGTAGKFVKDFSSFRLIIILVKSWCFALVKSGKMMGKRRVIQNNKKIVNYEIINLFKTFRISAKELVLKE